mmetsp:Transcript_35718/g.57386  ORF Transcript_35718/g.57386 Transcript_35718/m.57386 type:complete len:483 (-) Transcript_35718:169-1617(-)
MEENRMRKLWTDFAGSNESIFSELRFCRDTSYFVTSNSIAHKMSTAIKLILSEYFEQESGVNIVDGLSCIGGNTYSFAKVFDAHNDEIYANELDVARYQALKHNMNVFAEHGLVASRERFHFYNVDFLQLHEALGAEKCGAMDVVFLDPEWNNGDDYKQTNREMIHLFNIGALHLYQVVNRLLNEWYVNLKIIAIKVAKNYDQQFLMRKFQKCKLIESKRFRIAQLSFHNQTLVLIVRARAAQHAQANEEEVVEDDHKLQGNVEKEEEEEEEAEQVFPDNFARPPRSHYCHELGSNILRMDHFCVWLNNAVGFYNYKFFLLTITYLLLCCALSIAIVIYRVFIASATAMEYGVLNTMCLLLSFVVCVFFVVFSVMHCCMHVWQMSKNLTSIEYHKYNNIKAMAHHFQIEFPNTHEFDHGIFGNCQRMIGYDVWFWLLPFAPALPEDPYKYDINFANKQKIEHVTKCIQESREKLWKRSRLQH